MSSTDLEVYHRRMREGAAQDGLRSVIENLTKVLQRGKNNLIKSEGSSIEQETQITGNSRVVSNERTSPVSEETGGQRGKRTARGTPTVQRSYGMLPDVADALKRAASAEGVSTSRFLNKLLADHDDIQEHLEQS